MSSLTIEELALKVAADWREKYEEHPEIFADLVALSIEKGLEREVEALAISKVATLGARERISDIADHAIAEWLRRGDIRLPPPRKETAEIIGSELASVGRSPKVAARAARKKKIVVYAMKAGGATFGEIADRLVIPEVAAEEIYKAAERDMAALRDELNEYLSATNK
jgi:hypothetical protein